MNTPTERQAAIGVLAAIVNSLKLSPDGLPAGLLYAAMRESGCSKESFDLIMEKVCATGLVELRKGRYHLVTQELSHAE